MSFQGSSADFYDGVVVQKKRTFEISFLIVILY